MNKKELYKVALSNVPRYSLLNEIFAIRDNRFQDEENDYTIKVYGSISIDVLNKYVRFIDRLVEYQSIDTINNLKELKREYQQLKEIEKEHQRINGELRVENKELKDRIKTYEEPEDLTLMFMYCDEKAKDKMKELKKQQKEFIKYLENESNEVIRDAGYHKRICLEILSKYKEIIGDKE